MSSTSSAMGSPQGSSSGILKVGVEEYFEEEFDLKHSKKKEILKELLAQLSGSKPQGVTAPTCFISYAWPEETHPNYEKQRYHQHWVWQLAELLEKAAVTVFFDKWEDSIARPINRFIEKLAEPSVFVLVIGTRLYAEKCKRTSDDINTPAHVVEFEGQLIDSKLRLNALRRERVFPLLLEGSMGESFSPLIEALGQIPCDFTKGSYFGTVLRLVQNLYKIDNRNVEFQALVKDLEIRTRSIDERISDEIQRKYKEEKIREKLDLQNRRTQRDETGSTSPRHSPRHYALSEKSKQEDRATRTEKGPSTSFRDGYTSFGLSMTSHTPPASPQPARWNLEQWRESVLKNEETAQALELYVPVRAGSSLHDTSPSDLLMQVMAFLEDGEAQVLLLLGGSGSGKSSFGQYLEQELWYRPEQAKGRIPLWINLPGLNDPQREAVREAFKQKGVPPAAIERLRKEKTFLFILDGYDEIRAEENLCVSNRLETWKAKVLVTCRQEYFMADPGGHRYQFMPVKAQKPVPSGLWERYIAPFSKDEVSHYLQGYIHIKKSDWSLPRYLEQIERLPELKELIETPFLLRITAEVLPKVVQRHEQDKEALKLTRLALYEAFVTEWFERHLAKYMQNSSIGVLGANPMETLRGFSERLAIKMYEAGLDAVQYEENKPSPWTEFFKDEPRVNLMRRACPLKKAGAYRYAFIHRSLLEYFLTPSLLKEISHMSGNGREGVSTVTPTVFPDLEALNRKLLNSEPSVVHFLVDAVRSNPSLKDKLFSILEASKQDEQVAIAAANAATILNAARTSFVGRDLSHTKLAGADLSHGIYDATNFEGADLRNVALRGAWLHRTNFQNARMEGVRFEEYPALSFGDAIKSCCYSPDGRWLAVAHGNDIEILDAATRKKQWSLRGHSFLVYSVAFSPDGKRLVSGSLDNTLRLWDAERGEPLLKPLEGHTNLVGSVAFSPDGKKVVSGSRDKTVRLWDTERGEPLLKPFEGHKHWVMSVAFSPDGRKIASGSGDNTVRLWDVEHGEPLLKPLEGHANWVTGVAFSPDGRKVVSGSWDNTVRLWDVERGEPLLKSLEGHTRFVTNVAFSPDGRRVVSGSWDNTLRLWDVESGKPLSKPLEGHTNIVNGVAFSPDGKWVMSVSEDKTLRFWNVEQGEFLLKRPLGGHTSVVTSVTFSPDGRKIVSASKDETVRLWDVEHGEPLLKPLLGHTSWVMSVAFSPDGRKVVSGSLDRTVRLWDVERGEPLLKPFEGHTGYVWSVAFGPDGKRLVSGSWDKAVRLWDAERREPLLRPFEGHTDGVTSVAFNPDGRRVVFGSKDKTLRLWDVESGDSLLRPLEGHTNWVTSVAFSPDGRKVVSGSYDWTARLWDVERRELLLKPLEGHTSTVRSVAFSPDGKLVASVGDDGILMMHDGMTGRICHSLHTFVPINSVAWHNPSLPHAGPIGDGASFLATGHSDTSVRYWRRENCQLTLLWSSYQGTLASEAANIEGAQLSGENAELLRQRGAVGEPSVAGNTPALKDETKNAQKVTPIPTIMADSFLEQTSARPSTSAVITPMAVATQQTLSYRKRCPRVLAWRFGDSCQIL